MKETASYINDVIGLKSLDNAGKIKRFEGEKGHLRLTHQEYSDFILPFLI